jgi:hypothetical protein
MTTRVEEAIGAAEPENTSTVGSDELDLTLPELPATSELGGMEVCLVKRRATRVCEAAVVRRGEEEGENWRGVGDEEMEGK